MPTAQQSDADTHETLVKESFCSEGTLGVLTMDQLLDGAEVAVACAVDDWDDPFGLPLLVDKFVGTPNGCCAFPEEGADCGMNLSAAHGGNPRIPGNLSAGFGPPLVAGGWTLLLGRY